jgi:hypothetical protein
MRAVLQACDASPRCLAHCEHDADGSGGCLLVADLLRQTPGRRAVVKASLSRTLRRLWRAGCVELVNAWGYSLRQMHADARGRAARRPSGRPMHVVQITTFGRERLRAEPRGRPVTGR